jgi:hypothetical protein
LKATEAYTYFKYATAAGVLQLVSQQVAAGSIPALQALIALSSLAQDSGTALLAAYGSDNPYAGALVKLNDANPTLPQIGSNLGVLGQVAAAGAADAANGTNTVSALVVSKAVAAIDTVSGFAISDAANTGSATDLSGTSRVRVATDLFAILALGAVQVQFGVTVTPYKSAIGATTLSGADFPGLLANRISAAPTGAGTQELKEWMALLSYLQSGLKGNIPSAYASTSDFTQFSSAGAAVQTRNVSYPLANIAQLSGTLSSLLGSPPCPLNGTPVVTAVTTGSYTTNLSATGTIVVWGFGFTPGGGNSIQMTRVGATDSVTLNASTGSYFWNLSANQINAALPSGTVAGQWLLSVKNACGATSGTASVTLQ